MFKLLFMQNYEKTWKRNTENTYIIIYTYIYVGDSSKRNVKTSELISRSEEL